MKFLHAVIMTSALIAIPACSQSSVNTADKEAIGKIVQEYIMDNPGIVMDALIKHEENQNWESINAVRSAIFDEERDIVVGPKDAKVTIVEFFDYNCSACKSSTNWVADAMKDHPNDIRVIFKEAPILDGRSRTSKNAARAALAAARQDKYFEMHMALMNNDMPLINTRIEELASEVGLDVDKLKEDMKDPAFTNHIDDTMTLIGKIRPFGGTPFFIIGDEFVPGANISALTEALDKALAG